MGRKRQKGSSAKQHGVNFYNVLRLRRKEKEKQVANYTIVRSVHKKYKSRDTI